ncbi:streptophobe family protein, partial [Streptomyces sp. T21Q-yed]
RTAPGARPVGGSGGSWGAGASTAGAGGGPDPGAVRPSGADAAGSPVSGGVRDPGPFGFAGRCALRLAIATALTLPLLAWLTELSVDASLSVLGFDAFGAGVELRGSLGMALLLGAA